MADNMKDYLKTISEAVFSELKGDEEASLGLHSEESDFIRFNHSKVRQNTSVHQHEVQLQFQTAGRTYKASANLTMHADTDIAGFMTSVRELRKQLPLTDLDPKFTPIVNHGVSEVFKKSIRPASSEVVARISSEFADADLAGLYSAGPLRVASVNSKGQFHYFENDQFFFDYSIYEGPRAAKGYFSHDVWDDKALSAQAAQLKNTLSLLKRPAVKVKPGAYRTYLGPMAVDEIVYLFNWRAMSRSSYEQGFAPLKKLFLKEQLFSKQFSLIENNELGLNSHFNSLGEVSPTNLPLIENGELKNFLISTASAKEYNLISNYAEPHEGLRSVEVRAGSLDESSILSQIGTGLYLTNLHYINWSDPQAARITGMTRFACFWVENGEIVGPIQDMRFDDTLYNIFGSELLGLTSHANTFISTSTYRKRSLGGSKIPGLLLNKMNFTL